MYDLPAVPSKNVTLVRHPQHLYEFIFHHASRESLDDWYLYVEAIYQFPSETVVRMLIDTRQSGDLPLQYAYQKARQALARHPRRPTPMYYVFLTRPDRPAVLRLLDTFIRLLGTKDKVHYLYGDRREEALAVLGQYLPLPH
ncbi:MAG: hypothetical protein MUE40_20595 [Anaerolineae bacterium]|jgi:hypothetical protein|nr:hypothetical protein [Anaerolineae bacterium]